MQVKAGVTCPQCHLIGLHEVVQCHLDIAVKFSSGFKTSNSTL